MHELVPRVLRMIGAALRSVKGVVRHSWIRWSTPRVWLGAGTRIAQGVVLKATDGGTIAIHKNCYIAQGTTLIAKNGFLEVGENVFIGPWSTLVSQCSLRIGTNALIAERVTIRDQDHEIHGHISVPIAQAGFQISPITIGDGAWIGAGAVILKGVTVGHGAVVAANAVVTRDVADCEIVGGVPARHMGMRKGSDA